MQRQFTATCYVVFEKKFLLLFHPKHQRWLPPGGHLEQNETPHEAAIREVREETGLEIKISSQENIWTKEWNAESIPRPYCCLLESIPARGNEPAHEHVDFIFVGHPIGGTLTEGAWLSLEGIEALKTHEEIFADTQEIVRKLLTSPLSETLAQKF